MENMGCRHSQIKMERTVQALRRNRMDAHCVQETKMLLDKISAYLGPQASCSWGGSQTLLQTGVISFLKGGDRHCWDRDAPGQDRDRVHRMALQCDVYFTGCNAITEQGQLYNVDGNGNRIAALAYGPKKVIVVAGINKIVADVGAARARVRQIAAPANARRYGCDTPCVKTGICADCGSPERICCHELVTGPQMHPG